jgi:hypothetical protein
MNMTLDSDNEQFKNFLGKKYPYYEKKWAFIGTKKIFSQWNWAAFACPLVWFAYRKMYFYLFITTVLIVSLSIAEEFFGFSLGNGVNIGLGTVFGIYGNAMYKRYLDQKIQKLKQHTPLTQGEETSFLQGKSTSITAAMITTLILISLIVGALYLDS